MLSFDDPRWNDLTHAYGTADDTPPLLRALLDQPDQAGPDNEVWFTLWSNLCHQGDVYSASYAAVPHIVQMALSSGQPVSLDFFLLPACVEVARINGRGPAVPDDLSSAYVEAIRRLPDAVGRHHAEDWTRDMTIAATSAIAASKKQAALAEAIMNLDDVWIAKINRGDETGLTTP